MMNVVVSERSVNIIMHRNNVLLASLSCVRPITTLKFEILVSNIECLLLQRRIIVEGVER